MLARSSLPTSSQKIELPESPKHVERLPALGYGIPKLSTVHEPKPNHTFIKAGASGFRYQYLLKHSCGVFVIKSISCKTVGLTLGLTSPIPKNEKRLGTYSVAGPLHPHA